MDSNYAVLISHEHFVKICEYLAVALFGVGASVLNTRMRQIITSQNHILCRSCDWGTVLRRQNVVYREHEESCFRLSFYRKRYMNRHLVSVEVSVECRTRERMKLDRFTLYENRLKCLDTESVKCRRTVEHYRMLFDNTFKYIPYFRSYLFNHPLCALDVVCISLFNEFLHNERLEQFQCHFLRKSALVELELRSYYDYGTARVVNTLSEQVLSESSLLTLEHVG